MENENEVEEDNEREEAAVVVTAAQVFVVSW